MLIFIAPFNAFDGHFNLAQHLLTDFADRIAEHSNCIRRIPIKDAHKVLVLKVLLRIKSAARHERVGDAGSGRFSERGPNVKFIVLLKERSVNDTEDVTLVLLPVIRSRLLRDVFDLMHKAVIGRNTEARCQRLRDRLLMARLQLPQVWIARGCAPAGVRNVKHIADIHPTARHRKKRDSLRTAPHISVHRIVPQLIACAGSRLRALCVDHQLILIIVFVQPGGRFKKARPVLIAARQASGGLLCKP